MVVDGICVHVGVVGNGGYSDSCQGGTGSGGNLDDGGDTIHDGSSGVASIGKGGKGGGGGNGDDGGGSGGSGYYVYSGGWWL
jgi:hypothetical protein